LAALALAQRFSLLTINQQKVQLGSKLSEVLRTNCGIEAIFRCHAQDAEALSHVLPVSARTERPSEERRAVVERMVSLPQRRYLWWVKDEEVPAHFVQARQVDRAALRRAVAELPELREELGHWPGESATVPHLGVTVALPPNEPRSTSNLEPEMEDRESPYPGLG
jgi:hypothetical protein